MKASYPLKMFRSWVADDTGVIVQTCAYNTSSVSWNSVAGELTHNSAAISLWGSDTVTNLWDLFEFADLEGNYANVDRRVYAESDDGARVEFRIWFNSSGVSSASFTCTAPDCTGFSETIPVASSLYGSLVHDRLSIANIPCFNWRSLNLFEDHFIPVNAFNPLLHFGGFVRNTQTTSASISQTQYYDNGGGKESEKLMIAISKIWFSGGGGSDPYADGGYSTGTDTGTGSFDDSSESVGLPTTYAYSATAAGLISQYVVTEAELRTFGAWLWYGGSIIDDLKHFFQSPMEAIFSVGMLPFTPSDTTDYHIYVGSLDANTTGKLVNDTVEKISMGSITFDGYYGSALDFNPYTKIEIFLPYCGNFALNPDEVMGHTISVDYYCDSVSGDCVAFVSDEDRVLYQVKGNCFVQIPLAARDFTAQYASAIGAVGTVAAGLAASVASGGMSAPIAVGMGTSMASNAMNAKSHIARAGGVSGMAGFMSIQNPYVIITIPNQCLPEFQAEYQGYPLFVTKALKEFSGFTKVYEIHLDGLDCTDAEAKEIYDLLKGGVIL